MKTRKGPGLFFLVCRPASTKPGGFTLIELLVAISIFAVIVVVLYSCFRGGVVSYRRLTEEAASQQRLRYMLLTMERDFKNAFFMSNIPFQGYDNRLSLTTMITDSDNAAINAGRVSYYLKPGENAYMLARKTESMLQSLTFFTDEPDFEAETLPDTSSGREEIVAEGISDIRFAYLHFENQPASLPKQDNWEEDALFYEWVDLWEENALPVAVRAEIIFSDPRARAGKTMKRVWIPAATPISPEIFDE